MKKKILVALVCAILVFTLVPFSVAAKPFDTNKDKFKDFTANAEITQTYTSGMLPDENFYVNGSPDSYHWKTIGEQLSGSITDCDWDVLDGASITMVNDSYYTLDVPSYHMLGNSISTITIKTADRKGELTFKAAGPMDGFYPAGVDATMTVISKSVKGEGALTQVDPEQLAAFFYWMQVLDEDGNMVLDENGYPTFQGFGTGTITGHYKNNGWRAK